MRLHAGDIWTIESEVGDGRKHSGVVVLSSGKLAGGDAQYLYVGRYRFRDGRIAARIKVKHYNGEAYSVFDRWETDFAVRFVGEQRGNVIRGEMLHGEVPTLKLAAQMVWRGSIGPHLPPPRRKH
jgi:hypothetical protein